MDSSDKISSLWCGRSYLVDQQSIRLGCSRRCSRRTSSHLATSTLTCEPPPDRMEYHNTLRKILCISLALCAGHRGCGGPNALFLCQSTTDASLTRKPLRAAPIAYRLTYETRLQCPETTVSRAIAFVNASRGEVLKLTVTSCVM